MPRKTDDRCTDGEFRSNLEMSSPTSNPHTLKLLCDMSGCCTLAVHHANFSPRHHSQDPCLWIQFLDCASQIFCVFSFWNFHSSGLMSHVEHEYECQRLRYSLFNRRIGHMKIWAKCLILVGACGMEGKFFSVTCLWTWPVGSCCTCVVFNLKS
jgi:hypothetical protein